MDHVGGRFRFWVGPPRVSNALFFGERCNSSIGPTLQSWAVPKFLSKESEWLPRRTILPLSDGAAKNEGFSKSVPPMCLTASQRTFTFRVQSWLSLHQHGGAQNALLGDSIPLGVCNCLGLPFNKKQDRKKNVFFSDAGKFLPPPLLWVRNFSPLVFGSDS